MPTYIYQCVDNEEHGEFEVFQSIKDPPIKSCPCCIKEGKKEEDCNPPKKLIAATSFVLKGGDGQILGIADMASYIKKTTIIKAIKLLKFILTDVDDKEIVSSTIESIIEMLEEELK